MVFYAHTLPPPSEKEAWEPLEEHLERVAHLAARFAQVFGAAEWGRLAGLWHDVGKYSTEFQAYLAGGDDGHLAEVAGRVNHSTAGAKHASTQGALGRLLAYCIAGHHAGLPDDDAGNSGLSMRLVERVPSWTAAPAELLAPHLLNPPKLTTGGDGRLVGFSVGFFTRMIFSTLVDADFLATESFMDAQRAGHRANPCATPADLLSRLDERLHSLRREAPHSLVNEYRQSVLIACRESAALPPGLFSLNVPTGGGKTLSSLAFALTHAVVHGLQRVIYAIPFTSIIEQTAQVFRHALGDLASEVLEHHSNLDTTDPKRQNTRLRLAAENFDASLVVTTNVQLFESLFASRTSPCRKLHRLAKSVIILDEAQTLPPRLLAPTLAALKELVLNYGATVVLCTATQPAIERRDGFPIGMRNVRPIINEPEALHAALRRTRLQRSTQLSNAQIVESLAAEQQVLCIVNSKRHAADLFAVLNDPDALHLSANMCPEHRASVVAEIHRRLQEGHSCRVISTQVVEAGVDVDFPTVYRATAGLDSIAQAAGRCNREGRLVDANGQPRLGTVVVFEHDETKYRSPDLIRDAAQHFREIADDYADDLLSPAAIDAYFRLHYWQQGGEDGRGWDRGHKGRSVMECFSSDGLHHQFRTAAERYRLIDDTQTGVVVPYGRGLELIHQLQTMPAMPDPVMLRSFDRTAQRYVVSAREDALHRLVNRGVVQQIHGRHYLALESAYDHNVGLKLETTGLSPQETVL